MSLKVFHVFFIVVSIAFSVYFGMWGMEYNSESPSHLIYGMSVCSFLAGLGLVAYLVWFLKKSKNIGFLTLFVAMGLSLATQSAYACPVCVGNPNHPMTRSTNSGVWFLLVVITGVLLGFASLFCFWVSRERRLQKQLKF